MEKEDELSYVPSLDHVQQWNYSSSKILISNSYSVYDRHKLKGTQWYLGFKEDTSATSDSLMSTFYW